MSSEAEGKASSEGKDVYKFLDELIAGETEEQKERARIHAVLHVPMNPATNDARANSIGQFLSTLLSTLWIETESFSGKRPLGNSDWQWQVYHALARSGFIPDTVDEYGELDMNYEDQDKADDLIVKAIGLAFNH